MSEKDEEYEQAKNEQRPFVAVVNDDDLPGWQALYVMGTTGEDRRNWYYLTDSGVDEVEKYRKLFENDIQHESWVSQCSDTRGELHGLSKVDAIDLAEQFADIVWDNNNWKEVTPREIFQGDY